MLLGIFLVFPISPQYVWSGSTLFALNTGISLKPGDNKFYWKWTCLEAEESTRHKSQQAHTIEKMLIQRCVSAGMG